VFFLEEKMDKKIVVVSNMYPSLQDPVYGSFVKEQTEELEKKGLKINRIVSYDRAEGNKKRALMKYLSLWSRTVLSAFNFRNKIYHFHYVFPTALVAPILKSIFRKKIVFTFHGSDLLKGGKRKEQLLRKILPFADEIILVSDYMKKEFIHRFPEHKDKTHSIHCGVNTELFKPRDRYDAQTKLQLPTDKFNVLYLGRLIKDKGIDVFEDIVEKLKDNKEIRFIIVGGGQELERIQRKYEEYENVFLHPSIPKNEVPLWFNASDVFVFPTKREAFGLVALESIASGTPVLSHNVGGVSEIIEDNQNGFLLDLNDSNEFVTKILELQYSPSIKNSFSIKGFEKSKGHTLEKQINKIVNVYKKL
jgi:glycosyltransferase involved in cell wall biosynthesis